MSNAKVRATFNGATHAEQLRYTRSIALAVKKARAYQRRQAVKAFLYRPLVRAALSIAALVLFGILLAACAYVTLLAAVVIMGTVA